MLTKEEQKVVRSMVASRTVKGHVTRKVLARLCDAIRNEVYLCIVSSNANTDKPKAPSEYEGSAEVAD